MSKNLIDIPAGTNGLIDGELYFSEESNLGCAACDLGDLIAGCSKNNVICFAPQRVFKKVNCCDYDYDYDDCNDLEMINWYEALLLIVILIIPVTYILMKETIKKIIKNDSDKQK
jgi:hypothetical protein